ncbi:MAG: ATP synthase F0 subunit C [Desulfobacterales bacterium]|nr:ATP synthase F0 subunit C [Desulfobacterales bacterium]
MEFLVSSVWAAGLAIGIAAVGCGLAQGIGLNGAMAGISRNPEAAGKIQVNMLIGLALIESLCIYALVVSMILLFVHPAIAPAVQSLGG